MKIFQKLFNRKKQINKIAILIGISYSVDDLETTINNVESMKLLLDKLNYKCITLINSNGRVEPTKVNIISTLINSIEERPKNIFFYYCGKSNKTTNNNFSDDNCLVPSDYDDENYIDINELLDLFESINHKTNLFCLFDCKFESLMKYNYIFNYNESNDIIVKIDTTMEDYIPNIIVMCIGIDVSVLTMLFLKYNEMNECEDYTFEELIIGMSKLSKTIDIEPGIEIMSGKYFDIRKKNDF